VVFEKLPQHIKNNHIDNLCVNYNNIV
jgi:hypothetical protein